MSDSTLYPHNLDDEESSGDKTRLLKARFPDQEPPNTRWFWIALGNCRVCAYFRAGIFSGKQPSCANAKISEDEFRRYVLTNTCPEFEAGMAPDLIDLGGPELEQLDAMKAAGLVAGTPSQPIALVQNLPWSRDAAAKAHAQQDKFRAKAQLVDSGEENDPRSQEYEDLADDLGPI